MRSLRAYRAYHESKTYICGCGRVEQEGGIMEILNFMLWMAAGTFMYMMGYRRGSKAEERFWCDYWKAFYGGEFDDNR